MLRQLHKLKAVRALPRLVAGRRVPALSPAVFQGAARSISVASMSRVQVGMSMASRTFATLDIPVPSMGDSISEGTVVEWVKAVGDRVEVDDVVVVLETDKVSVDVRSPTAGVVADHLAVVDATVLVGAPLFRVTEGAAGASSTPATAASTPAPAAAAPAAAAVSGEPITVNVPSMGDSISEGTVVSWTKGAGDHVDVDEVVLVLETDKVSVDVRAPQAGVIQKTLVNVDDVVEIGAPLFHMVPGAAPAAAPKPVAAAPVAAAPAAAPKAAPTAAPKAAAPKVAENVAAPVFLGGASREVRREKMNRMRLRIAERLKESQNTSASLTTFQEVDMSKLMAMRKTYKDAFEAKHNVKLGFMSAFIKASANALLEVPGVNASIDEEHSEIVYRDFVDISVAVATPKGLVTPVLRNTESMSFADVEKSLAHLAEKARAGGITMEDLAGGTFTISNGGVFGSLMGTPIINVPQSGILGMHATKMRPVVLANGEIVARPMMYLALTYDHRLVDGREAVTCLKSIADKIADPERLLLDL
ncbi:dihydrolipoamide succinyltransferase [Achlya hypogyna]|uniref:dihydrolipoyllysine-residue succinyltransferase n=1 Tax=Achlya hypogyna TaxID=1202772 RepID=A0A1V9ZDL0_ACHHY|nr:dihydrolipoamide succinyltransferase [Achlya hypogyna]